MRIVVSHIPDAGQKVPVEGAWAEGAARTALDAAPRRLGGELALERTEDERVAVTGRITVVADRVCERCGEDVELDLDLEVDLLYAPMPAAVADDEEGADEDDDEDAEPEEDDDDGWYKDDALELADVLCEAIALALGPRVVCKDVGACDARTADLLARKGTSGNPGHPAFAKLKGLG